MSQPYYVGQVLSSVQDNAPSNTGAILVDIQDGQFTIWYIPLHRQYICENVLDEGMIRKDFRASTYDEYQQILMQFVDCPLCPGHTQGDEVIAEKLIKPMLDELQKHVPLEECPSCGMRIPVGSSDAQVRHMEEFHPDLIAERLRAVGIHRQADEVAAGRDRYFRYR